jgi:hypothetical protein
MVITTTLHVVYISSILIRTKEKFETEKNNILGIVFIGKIRRLLIVQGNL